MRTFPCAFAASAFVLTSCLASAQLVPGAWSQTWGDEFNHGAGDLNHWSYDTGNGGPSLPGWGNNELENYTTSTDNVSVSGGSLHIDAIANSDGTYTSGRIKTDKVFSQAYGLFEFRAKLPAGQGLWPAVWMLPEDSAYGGWPTSGEIDILESRGQEPGLVQGTLHSGPIWYQDHVQTQTYAGSGLEPQGFSSQDWHTYDLQWSRGVGGAQGSFTWYVDGQAYSTVHGGWYTPNGAGPDAPFDKPFYFLINMAVGGNYVGAPNLSPGSYDMQVDYVRAYQAAPEPTSLTALLVGSAVCWYRRRRT